MKLKPPSLLRFMVLNWILGASFIGLPMHPAALCNTEVLLKPV
jgi:hypothetical protein